MKLIKLVFWGSLVFFGLYFFGNFRVNDVNVRDYLQTKVTPQTLTHLKDQAVNLYQMLRQLWDHSQKNQSGEAAVTNPLNGKPMESLSPSDQEKLIKILQKNLDDLQQNQDKNKNTK